MDSYLIQGLALGFTAAASPGQFQTFLINQTLSGGWRRGAPLAFAPIFSDIPIVLTILLVLNRLPPAFLSAISLAGGVFALYLAWTGWKQWRAQAAAGSSASAPVPQADGRPVCLRGVLINALSAGPYTFWTLVNGPLVLAALKISALHAGLFLLGFYRLFIGGMLALVAIFHQARRLGPGLVRALSLLSLVILAVFAVILLQRGVLGLVGG
jgi:threonine/homoserine/homoserine lactone efflux protein